jgi:seryl-tRNA synthetase
MEGDIKTIEDLAALIKETMASEEDIKEVRDDMKTINMRLDGFDSWLDHLDARVGRIEADVHALRDEVVHRSEFEDVLGRVKYIEKKLAIESGV